MELTIGQMDKMLVGMRDITAAIEGIDPEDVYSDEAGKVYTTPVRIIQGNQVKRLQRIAADVEDGKIKAWEWIFQEAGRKS